MVDDADAGMLCDGSVMMDGYQIYFVEKLGVKKINYSY